MKIEPGRFDDTAVRESQSMNRVTQERLPAYGYHPRSGHVGLPPLELGQEIVGTVIEETGDGHVTLQVGASLVEAEDPVGLGVGHRLTLRVESLQPQVVLHIVDKALSTEEEVIRFLRQHLQIPFDEQEPLAALQAKAETFLSQANETDVRRG